MEDSNEIESSVELSDRNWNRVIDAATKAGYREGVEEGKQSVFQQGFDIGYEDAFKTAFILGKYKGLVTSSTGDRHTPSSVQDILDKTRRGACHICVKESKQSKDPMNDSTMPPLQEVRNKQREQSEEQIGTLHRYLGKLLNDQGMSVDDFSLC